MTTVRQTAEGDLSQAPRLWSIHDVSSFIGVPVATIYQWRVRGDGPPAMRLGRHLRGRFLSWLQSVSGKSLGEFHIREHLRSLGLPCLIVHDLDDLEVPWGDGELYARHWSSSRLLTTRGLGHHEIVDAPEVIDAS